MGKGSKHIKYVVTNMPIAESIILSCAFLSLPNRTDRNLKNVKSDAHITGNLKNKRRAIYLSVAYLILIPSETFSMTIMTKLPCQRAGNRTFF